MWKYIYFCDLTIRKKFECMRFCFRVVVSVLFWFFNPRPFTISLLPILVLSRKSEFNFRYFHWQKIGFLWSMFTSFYYKNTPPLIFFFLQQHKKSKMDMKLNIEWVVGIVHFPGDVSSHEFKITVYTPIEEVRETL